MEKQSIGIIIIVLLLMSSLLPVVNSTIINNTNQINLRFNGEIDKQINVSKPTIIDTPDYFNWRDYEDYDWTTSAKDQGNCGSCWNYAANGALECIIKIRENCPELKIDLSEQYVLSCLPRAGSCNGGWAYRAYKYIMRNDSWGNNCNGTIPESCFPYQANDSIECEQKCNNWEDYLIPLSDYNFWRPSGSIEDREAIKSQIMQEGPVVTSMLATYYIHGENNLEEWGWEHHNPNDYYPYPGPVESANHQVVIVGWKDDISINNGGYWIVKNSFSEEWGYDGFFNIEYGSLNIDSIQIDSVDINPEEYVNWLPNANTNGDYIGETNQEILFDGSKSFDHEGSITSYNWNFGDGTQANGINVNHSYEEKGIYPVKLTVVDNNENTDIDEKWVYIDKENTPPNKPTIDGSSKGKNGTLYEYTFSTEDPDGDEIYFYIVWGETYWEGWWESWIGPYKSGEEVKVKNIWYDKGNYTVRVKAKDIYDAKSEWTKLDIDMSKQKTKLHFDLIIEKMIKYFPFLKIILDKGNFYR